ncbi:hypothetical protein KSP40_PGU020716 [Platanthera guangdongensis]|uniref:Uncharacterized protein n=1 Tax=Platanthera guangdongensis TaxID=2320717 RepID=A0ABR2LTZ1_9ASPA
MESLHRSESSGAAAPLELSLKPVIESAAMEAIWDAGMSVFLLLCMSLSRFGRTLPALDSRVVVDAALQLSHFLRAAALLPAAGGGFLPLPAPKCCLAERQQKQLHAAVLPFRQTGP